jgi:hypothetical protein
VERRAGLVVGQLSKDRRAISDNLSIRACSRA